MSAHITKRMIDAAAEVLHRQEGFDSSLAWAELIAEQMLEAAFEGEPCPAPLYEGRLDLINDSLGHLSRSIHSLGEIIIPLREAGLGCKLDALLALLRLKEWPGWTRENADGKSLSADDLKRLDELIAGVEGDQAEAMARLKLERAAMHREYASMHNAAQWPKSDGDPFAAGVQQARNLRELERRIAADIAAEADPQLDEKIRSWGRAETAPVHDPNGGRR